MFCVYIMFQLRDIEIIWNEGVLTMSYRLKLTSCRRERFDFTSRAKLKRENIDVDIDLCEQGAD